MFRFLFVQADPPVDAAEIAQNTTERVQSTFTRLASMSFDDAIQYLFTEAVQVTIKILIALVIYLVGRWIIRKMQRLIDRIFARRRIDSSLRIFISNTINVVMILILVIIIVSVLGINTTSFVALFASAGIAIGMALSGTLQNIAGGVLILLQKPFHIGDYIETQQEAGTVKQIRLFNTVLNTPDNRTIILPNGNIAGSIIDNYSQEATRRLDMTFSIGYGDDYDLAKNLLQEMLENDQRVLKKPTYLIAISQLSDNSVDIAVQMWVGSNDYWGVTYDMNERVYKNFLAKGLNIPYPQLEVHINDAHQSKQEKQQAAQQAAPVVQAEETQVQTVDRMPSGPQSAGK